MYFLKGRLPWQGLHRDKIKAKYDLIKKVKEEVTINELTEGLPD